LRAAPNTMFPAALGVIDSCRAVADPLRNAAPVVPVCDAAGAAPVTAHTCPRYPPVSFPAPWNETVMFVAGEVRSRHHSSTVPPNEPEANEFSRFRSVHVPERLSEMTAVVAPDPDPSPTTPITRRQAGGENAPVVLLAVHVPVPETADGVEASIAIAMTPPYGLLIVAPVSASTFPVHVFTAPVGKP
jgi:hypothetical protein